MIKVPDNICANVDLLIAEIGSDIKPIYLLVTPEKNVKIQECFPSVINKIDKDGGNIQYGWQIWEEEGLLVEAEAHAVWVSPDNELVDITPKQIHFEKILFIPDNNLKFEEQQIDNIRINTSGNKLVDDLITLCELQFIIMNRGERANQFGAIPLSTAEAALYRATEIHKALALSMAYKKMTKNYKCLCGSGKKYKHCHGHNFDKNIQGAKNKLSKKF